MESNLNKQHQINLKRFYGDSNKIVIVVLMKYIIIMESIKA